MERPDPHAGLVLLVLRAQTGDRQALDRLLRDHQAALYRHIRTIARDGDLALDALQNSLLLIARRLTSLRDPRWFKAWAYRIATREAVRTAKREARVHAFEDEAAPEADGPIDAALPEECLHRLAELPPAAQIVVRLHYLEEMTFVEVAEALEIPVGTVKSRLAYGLARLRASMA
ncbi:MAG TPA: RNA polymerase sigma factor [Allosphingosinicella sp.]|nr:RNA polymerase sigma factor [Allosphingosinicella sp.]